MRFVSAAAHQVLDFVTVVAFALAPAILGLSGLPATLAYVLAAVHLTLTLLTRFTPSSTRLVPLRLHGAVEGLVGLALLALPWLLHWGGTPRTFYAAAGAVILLVWAVSRYGGGMPASSH